MSLSSSTKTLQDHMTTRRELHISWLKQILLMASGVSGILVSLHTSSEHNARAGVAFVLIVLLLSLGILGLSIALYSHVHLAKRLQLKLIEAIQQQLRENTPNHAPVHVEPLKIFAIAETIGYGSLVLALVSFVWYSIEVSLILN